MGRQLHLDPAAEKEATDIGKKFMNSTDVVGDMSRAYGADLSSVRIHTDESAARRTAERGVDAFSTGKDVFFAQGAFDKGDPASRGLLAHELSHSLQQGVGGDTPAMAQSAPMGAAQGGLISWFKNKMHERKIRKMQIADHKESDAQLDMSPEAQAYTERVHAIRSNAFKKQLEQVQAPEVRVGKRGNAAVMQNLYDVFHTPQNGQELSPIEAGNKAFRNHLDMSDDGRISAAQVDMGLRSDGPVKKAMDASRGTLFDNLTNDLAAHGRKIGRETDLENAMSGMTNYGQFTATKKNLFLNDQMGWIGQSMLPVVTGYLTSDEATNYFKETSNALKDADVYNSDHGTDLVDTQIGDLFLRSVAPFASVISRQEAEQAKAEGRKGKTSATATLFPKIATMLMQLPHLSKMSEEDLAQLPPQVQVLCAQYQQLVEQVHENLKS